MAEEENNEAGLPVDAEQAPTGGKKKGLVLGGGFMAVLAVAWVAATMAVPSKPQKLMFEGPFVAPLSSSDVQVNLQGNGNKRYLVMNLNIEFDAYAADYVEKRTADALYASQLRDALISVASRKQIEQVSDEIEKEIFKGEILEAVAPIIFPIHVGDSLTGGPDEASGLRPGISTARATLREPHADHVLHLNALDRTVRLDDGPAVKFRGTETDLLVSDGLGRTIYLDVTRVKEDFEGDLKVGVHGRARNVYWAKILVQ